MSMIRTADADGSTGANPTPGHGSRRADREYRNLHDSFDGDADGAAKLATAAGETMHEWGYPWSATPVARIAHVQASWLLHNDHPAGARLELWLWLEARRELWIAVGDAGSMLPVFESGDSLRAALHGAHFPQAAHPDYLGRELRCMVKLRTPYRLAYTWDSTAPHHPETTYQLCEDERDAHRSADAALNGIGTGARTDLLAIHIQGPDDEDEQWHPYLPRPSHEYEGRRTTGRHMPEVPEPKA